jgi:3-dehydroshikimate dehydratase
MEMNGIELWTGHIEDFLNRNGSLKDLKSLIRSYNLSIPAISPYTYFSKSKEESSKSTTVIERSLEIAAQLDCPMVRTFVGHIPSGEVSRTQWGQTIHDLKQVMKSTDQYGIYLGVEIHNNTFADRVESIRSIVKGINHPRLKLIFDGFNLFVDRLEHMDAFESLYSWVNHVHIKNFHWNHEDWNKSIPTSIFEGDVNQKQLLNKLVERNYQGFVSLEYFGPQAEKCIWKSIKQLKSYGVWDARIIEE